MKFTAEHLNSTKKWLIHYRVDDIVCKCCYRHFATWHEIQLMSNQIQFICACAFKLDDILFDSLSIPLICNEIQAYRQVNHALFPLFLFCHSDH